MPAVNALSSYHSLNFLNSRPRSNGEVCLYDGLGSERTFTNASGAVTAAAIYDGYGNTVAASGSTGSPYQFGATSGYRNDGDAGIMQVGARYDDTATGSLLTRDTDLNQLAYVYCGAELVDRLDPIGHYSWSLFVQDFKGAIQLDTANPVMMVLAVAQSITTIGTGAFGGGLYGPNPGTAGNLWNVATGGLGAIYSGGVINVGIGLIGVGGMAVIGAPILIGIGEVVVAIGGQAGWF